MLVVQSALLELVRQTSWAVVEFDVVSSQAPESWKLRPPCGEWNVSSLFVISNLAVRGNAGVS